MTGPDINRLFARAVADHAAGALAAAVTGYLHVIALRPLEPAPLVNLAMARQAVGDIVGALAACRRAVAVDPRSAEALNGLAAALAELGHPAEATGPLRRSITLRPDNAEAYNNLGNCLNTIQQHADAGLFFRCAVVLAPAQAEPYNNLGATLTGCGLSAEALLPLGRALTIRPANPQAENNLGNALIESDRIDPAIAAFRRAVAQWPDFTDAWINLGGALMDRGDIAAAIAACRQAAIRRPDAASAYNNLGNALKIAGRLEAADRAFRHGLGCRPDDAEIHFNHAAVLLKRGDFRAGWAEYEWRRKTPQSPFRQLRLPQAEWDGAPPAGRRIMLYAEQGLGDALQFCRFAETVAARGGRVILRVYPSLVRLLASLPGVVQVVSTEAPLPEFDLHLPLMSVPAVLGLDVDAIARRLPYLSPALADLAPWRDRLARLAGVKVGLAWSGDPRPQDRDAHLLDRRRSLTLAHFAELADIPGLSLVSLQKGQPAAQARTPPSGMMLFDAAEWIDDFADTAALLANLDLVISVDTSVAHLAGALGKPVWILSRFDGCWRWLEDRDDSPWYPTARLYRQAAPGDWPPVVRRLAGDLRRWCADRARPSQHAVTEQSSGQKNCRIEWRTEDERETL